MEQKIKILGKVSLSIDGIWENKAYDRLCVVNDGKYSTYISRKSVPVGIELTNEEYWQPVAKEIVKFVVDFQQKLAKARIVVENMEQRDALTYLDIAPGGAVYVKDVQQTYILDTIVPENNYKEWHLDASSRLGSEAINTFDGQYLDAIADRARCDEWGNNIWDTYVAKNAVKNLVLSLITNRLKDFELNIEPNSIDIEHLSESVINLLKSGENIQNLADEEDLTATTLSNGTPVLRFKNRVPECYKGFIRLRRNIKGQTNLLEQAMFPEPNTIYEVIYNYDLGGQTITIPENCTLLFNGGKFENGTIRLDNTRVLPAGADMTEFIEFPTVGTYCKGQCIYDVDLEKPIWWSGNVWRDATGALV